MFVKHGSSIRQAGSTTEAAKSLVENSLYCRAVDICWMLHGVLLLYIGSQFLDCVACTSFCVAGSVLSDILFLVSCALPTGASSELHANNQWSTDQEWGVFEISQSNLLIWNNLPGLVPVTHL